MNYTNMRPCALIDIEITGFNIIAITKNHILQLDIQANIANG